MFPKRNTMSGIDRHLIIGVCLLFVLSTGAALIVNGVSDRGIPLRGQWDIAAGAPTARPDRNHAERDINDLEIARTLFDRGDFLFIDARPESVFREGRIAGAVSFPVNEFQERIAWFLTLAPEETTSLVLYCSSRLCLDAHLLAEDLVAMGYTDVRVMIDGFDGWKRKGYPIESDAG